MRFLCHLPGDLQSLRSAGESRSMRRDPTKVFANLELPFQRQISPRKQPWQPVKKQPKSDHKDLGGTQNGYLEDDFPLHLEPFLGSMLIFRAITITVRMTACFK